MGRELLDVERRVLGPEHTTTLTVMGNLALSLRRQGKHAEAEQMGRELLDVERRVLGPEHPTTLTAMGNLATVLSGQGKHAEAEQMLAKLLDVYRRMLGPEHPRTRATAHNLSICIARERRSSSTAAIRIRKRSQRSVRGGDGSTRAHKASAATRKAPQMSAFAQCWKRFKLSPAAWRCRRVLADRLALRDELARSSINCFL